MAKLKLYLVIDAKGAEVWINPNHIYCIAAPEISGFEMMGKRANSIIFFPGGKAEVTYEEGNRLAAEVNKDAANG